MTRQDSFKEQVFSFVKNLLKDTNKIPYLFVGSGLSMRYMKSETWEGLLRWVCESVGSPMKSYMLYKQRAIADPGMMFPRITSFMEDDFLNLVLPSSSFAPWVEKHEAELSDGIPAMKVYIAEHLKTFKPIGLLDELGALKHASREIAGVITTNFDTLLESIFENYDCYTSQTELLFASTTGIGEIYKIHGSVTRPETMILTEKDFDLYKNKQDYMLSKILTIFGEYPIIFLGYSLNDQNVRDVIGALAKYAGPTRAQEFAKRFLFIDYTLDNPEIGRHSFTVGDGSIVEMTAIRTDDFTPIYNAIADNRQRLAPKVISQFSREIYRIGTSGKPVGSIAVVGLEDIDRIPQDKQIIVGIGRKDYGITITAKDLYEDAILNNKQLPASLVVESYLEQLLVQNSGGLPMFGYLVRYGKQISTPRISAELLKRTQLSSYLNKQEVKSKNRKRKEIKNNGFTIEGLISTYGKGKAYRFITALNEDEIDLASLKMYLISILERDMAEGNNFNTSLRKAINIYDFLENAKYYRSL